ncbi:ash family protein [Serratia ureilytica]|uniref:ash family protein n=1 Tax=Serratia ureilytica TaxID=300181 RepID=UPI0018D6AB32|nr:ash family protein [Serratia ureilytica]
MRSIERPGASYGLPPCPALRYSPPAVAKSAAGRGNPSLILATNEHAPRVFFYVAALVRSFLRGGCYAIAAVNQWWLRRG